MTRGTVRRLFAVLLLVVLPLASGVHTAHADEANRSGVSANGHGPWSHCPPANETPCLACASATLFGRPARAGHALPAPALAELLRDADPGRPASAPAARTSSRSPPRS